MSGVRPSVANPSAAKPAVSDTPAENVATMSFEDALAELE